MMRTRTGFMKYREVLSRPGAALFSVTATISRLPLSMTGLGIVLVVSEQTGSYGRAGVLAAVYVLAAAVFAPSQGRLADRLGQTPVLWVAGTVYPVGIALTVLAIESDWSAPWPHVCAALAGLSTPQTGSMARARWTHSITDRTQLNTAFAIEAVADEVVFVIGPVLVTFLTLQVADYAGLVFAAAAASLGCWALALQRRTAPPAEIHEPGQRPPLGWGLLAPVIAASLGLGVMFGATEVIIVAFTAGEGQRGAAGALLAIWAAGSLIAGVVVGALPQPADPGRRLRVSLLALSLLFAPLGLLPGVAWLAVGMLAAGVMISPTLIAMVSLIEARVPSARLTEALTWTTTGLAVGVAPGAAVAGWVVDEQGASAGFLVPVVAGLVASAVVWSTRQPDHARGMG